MEDARRSVLEMPDDDDRTSHEYLDSLAEVVLADERDRLAAAPTRLARALIEAGRTQAELAAGIGVSASAVGHWASGARPLPDGRINEIAAYLTMPSWGTDSPASLALSYFGWVKSFIAQNAGRPSDGEIAAHLGVTKTTLHNWTYGLAEVPEDKVTAFVQRFLPGQAAAYEVTT